MKMLIYLVCSLLLVTMSVWCFVFQREHLLMILLSLEIIVLSMFLMLLLSLSEFSSEISFSLLFLNFVFVSVVWACLSWFLLFVVMVMII